MCARQSDGSARNQLEGFTNKDKKDDTVEGKSPKEQVVRE